MQDRRRLLPKNTLPINILSIEDVNWVLNEIEGICPEEGKKECLAIAGYFPPQFGVWPTHRVYRIKYNSNGEEKYIIAKEMDKTVGFSEMYLLYRLKLYKYLYTPIPYYFLYDKSLENEFSKVHGILWMEYIPHQKNFEDYLVDYCMEKEEDFQLYKLYELLTSMWSLRIKHNDIKGEHLLLRGKKWWIIDFEKFKYLKDKRDINDEIAILISDATLYLDKFMKYNEIMFDVEKRARYKKFLSEIVNSFDVDLRGNLHLKSSINLLQTKPLRLSLKSLLQCGKV